MNVKEDIDTMRMQTPARTSTSVRNFHISATIIVSISEALIDARANEVLCYRKRTITRVRISTSVHIKANTCAWAPVTTFMVDMSANVPEDSHWKTEFTAKVEKISKNIFNS